MACGGNSHASNHSTTTSTPHHPPLPWRFDIKGFLVDITGVLYNSGPNGGRVIPGSVDAVNRLYSHDSTRVKFLSNESSSTRQRLLEKLMKLGFTLREEDFITPAPIAARYVRERQLRPHLLVHRGQSHIDFASSHVS